MRTMMRVFNTLFEREKKCWLSFDSGDRVSYHAGDEGRRAGALPAGIEHAASGQIPVEGHVSDGVLPVVDSEIGGAGSMYSGL